MHVNDCPHKHKYQYHWMLDTNAEVVCCYWSAKFNPSQQLKSVPGLEDVVAPSINTTTTSTATDQGEPTTVTAQSAANSTTAITTTTSTEGQDVVDKVQEETVTTLAAPESISATPVSQDPRFVRYFRMLKMGVPEPAVRMRMSADGLDPSILEYVTPTVSCPVAFPVRCWTLRLALMLGFSQAYRIWQFSQVHNPTGKMAGQQISMES